MNEFLRLCVSVLGYIVFTADGLGKIQMTLVYYYPTQTNTGEAPIQYYLSETDANATVGNVSIATTAKSRGPTINKGDDLTSTIQDSSGILPTENSRLAAVYRFDAVMSGRQITSIHTIMLQKEAEIVPKHGLITKTVSIQDKEVVIEMEPNNAVRYTEWRKGGHRLSRKSSPDRFNWTLATVNETDTGLYQCSNYGSRNRKTTGGILRLIVRGCPADHWGPPACVGICDNCYNGGVCDDQTGNCICPAGFKGKNCFEASKGRFGYGGEFQCSDIGGPGSASRPCQGTMFCLIDPFGCRCASGFKNFNCEEVCPSGTYGANCLQQCHCKRECDKFTGKCPWGCLDGYSGYSCQIPPVCKTGYYGSKCLDKCHCFDDVACDRQTGRCENELCADGYARQSFENCEVYLPVLPRWLMSETFHECNLSGNFSLSCDAVNATRIWWEHRSGQHRVVVSENQLLQRFNISFQDQGNYFCMAEGREQEIVESEPQVLFVSNYLQFKLTISSNEATSSSMENINHTIGEIKHIFENELLSVTPVPTTGDSYYLAKEITPEHFSISEMKQNIYTVFERSRNLTILSRNETIVSLHSLSFCSGETVVTAAGPLSFPDANVNSNASSLEVCLMSGDLHRGSRRCKGDFRQPAVWEYPSLLNCFKKGRKSQKSEKISEYFLKIVEDSSLTLQNASYIARDLADLTATNKIYNLNSLASALRKVSDVNCSSTVVTTCVVETIDNIMTASLRPNGTTDGQKLSQNVSSTFIQSLERQLENVRNSGKNYTNIKSNIAVTIVHVPLSENAVTFATLLPHSVQTNSSINSTVLTQELEDLNLTEISASIRLPKEVAHFVSNKTKGDLIPVTFVIHRSGVLFNHKDKKDFELNSLVISASVPEEIKDLPEGSNVLINFRPLQENGKRRSKCVYWNFSTDSDGGGWSEDGCVLISTGSSYSCRCNHLTNFAVLMDIQGDSTNKTLDLISSIGCVVSIISLVITVVSFLAVKNLRSRRPQQIVLNICLALIGLYTSFLVGIDKPHLGTWCIAFGGLIHYFCLASVAWMTVEAVNMYLLFVKVINARVDHFMIKASLFAWGFPMIVVIASIVTSTSSYSHPEYCFPKHSSNVFYVVVLGIMGAFVAFNAFIFAVIFWKLTCSSRAPTNKKSRTRQIRSRLQNAVAISVLLGLTWSFGFLAFGNIRLIFNTLFCISNSLQGFAIFILFCVRQKIIRSTWMHWLLIPSTQRQSSIKTRSQQRTTMTEDRTTSLHVLRERSQINS